MKKRLNKVIAHSGICSRRKADELIEKGKVTVNGDIVVKLGTLVEEGDDIRVKGKKISFEMKVYIIMNKPKNTLSAVSDSSDTKTVIDLIGKKQERVYPIGRLDKDSTGLLVLTNDGNLAYRLMHPKFEIDKVYDVTIKTKIKMSDIEKIRKGVYLEGKKTAPAKIKVLLVSDKLTKLRITIHEGRKRQVRKVFNLLGYNVKELKRIRYGPLSLDNLKTGQYRNLTKSEVQSLQKAVEIKKKRGYFFARKRRTRDEIASL